MKRSFGGSGFPRNAARESGLHGMTCTACFLEHSYLASLKSGYGRKTFSFVDLIESRDGPSFRARAVSVRPF